MISSDVRIGQTVAIHPNHDYEYVVLDRHPKTGHWWLQAKKSGRIGAAAHARDLVLLGDDYRPDHRMAAGPRVRQ